MSEEGGKVNNQRTCGEKVIAPADTTFPTQVLKVSASRSVSRPHSVLPSAQGISSTLQLHPQPTGFSSSQNV